MKEERKEKNGGEKKWKRRERKGSGERRRSVRSRMMTSVRALRVDSAERARCQSLREALRVEIYCRRGAASSTQRCASDLRHTFPPERADQHARMTSMHVCVCATHVGTARSRSAQPPRGATECAICRCARTCPARVARLRPTPASAKAQLKRAENEGVMRSSSP